MIWTKALIVSTLQALNRKKVDLSYNNLAKKNQALVSAAAYHFRSYRKAVEKAGLDYEEIVRRPRWTKPRIIAVIKAARKKNQNLNWAAVTRRRDDLGRAAFAAIQGRLFGAWERALTAAGLDADEVSRYRRWSKSAIVYEIKCRAADGEDLNSGCVQQEDPALHAAALRYFGGYDEALKAAKINPRKIRKRKSRND